MDEKFLADFDYSPVKKALTQVSLTLFRTETMFDLKFRLKGNATVSCDTCLDEFEMPVDSKFSLLIKFTEGESKLDNDEIIYLSSKEHEYDLKQYLYESFLLALPSKKSCEQAGKEHNSEVADKLYSAEKENDQNDPRWDALKDLLNKN